MSPDRTWCPLGNRVTCLRTTDSMNAFIYLTRDLRACCGSLKSPSKVWREIHTHTHAHIYMFLPLQFTHEGMELWPCCKPCPNSLPPNKWLSWNLNPLLSEIRLLTVFCVTSYTRELHKVFYKVEYGNVVFEFRWGREVVSPPGVDSLLASVCPFIAIKRSIFSERTRLSRYESPLRFQEV